MLNVKKLDPDRTISILANLGVIAGIMFLAFEINQNNTLLESQARNARAEVRRAAFRLQIESPEFNRIIYQNRTGGQFSEEEQELLNAYFDFLLVGLQQAYGDYRSDLIQLSEMQNVVSGAVFDRLPGLEAYWQTAKRRHDPEFVAWLDQIIEARR